jgi:hypothetical protein
VNNSRGDLVLERLGIERSISEASRRAKGHKLSVANGLRWRAGLNSPLSDPILVVGIDAAEGQGLIGAIHHSAELLGRKNAVVAMIVFDNDVVSRGESFEGLFFLKGVFGGGGFLRIYKVKARCMVNKNGSNRVAALHQLASTLCYQTGSLRDELVDGNYVARLCGRSADLSSMAASAPRAALGFAEEATHTFGHVAIRDALR